MTGEAFKKDFTFIPIGLITESTIEYADEFTPNKCCFALPTLATLSNSDPYQNDITSVYFGYSSIASSVNIVLIKDGADIGSLIDDTYGTFYHFGFHENNEKKYIGYKLDWKSILTILGTGSYQLRFDITTIFATLESEYSFEYCLKNYTPASSDETVRIEFTHNGLIGNWKDDSDVRSFKDLSWYNSIRLPKAIVLPENESPITWNSPIV